jgi:hypothetical protein
MWIRIRNHVQKYLATGKNKRPFIQGGKKGLEIFSREWASLMPQGFILTWGGGVHKKGNEPTLYSLSRVHTSKRNKARHGRDPLRFH